MTERFIPDDPGEKVVVLVWDEEYQASYPVVQFDGKWHGIAWEDFAGKFKLTGWFLVDDAHEFAKPKPIAPPIPDPTDVIIWYWSDNEEVSADIWHDEMKKVLRGYTKYKPREIGNIGPNEIEDDPQVLAKIAWDRWRYGDDLPPGDHRARVFVAKQSIYEIVKPKDDNHN